MFATRLLALVLTVVCGVACAADLTIFSDRMPTEVMARQHLKNTKFEVRYITIHNTSEPFSGPTERDIVYHRRDGVIACYHFAVDEVGAHSVIPERIQAWHAGDGNGDGNTHSIGIEICRSVCHGETDALYRRAEDNAAILAAYLLRQYHLTPNELRRHQDWTGKFCPHRILCENRWNEFVAKVDKLWWQNHFDIKIGAPQSVGEVHSLRLLKSADKPQCAIWVTAQGEIFTDPVEAWRVLRNRGALAVGVSSWLDESEAQVLDRLKLMRQNSIPVRFFYAPVRGRSEWDRKDFVQ